MSLSEPDKHLLELARKWLSGTISEEEKVEFEQWYNSFDDTYHEKLSDESVEQLEARLHQSIFDQAGIAQQIPIRRIRLWPRIAAAASVLLFLSVGGYFLLHKQPVKQTALNDIAPGSNKAILKLANGKTIVVTDAKNGLLVQQGNISIRKKAGGLLTYSSTAGNTSGVVLYDTLIVPRGGQHQVRFADGSMAYVNADSKLRIPENFEGSNRTVELISGEADFHVVHNAKMPFQVIAKGQLTKDIGTEFNINAYPDEPLIKTSLIEGSVRVSKNKQSAVLKPGQQAQVGFNESAEKIRVVNDADIDEVTAWKNGMFRFNGTPLENIMKQVSRWYDVDVVYKDESLNVKPFGAITTRFSKVSELLHVLEMTGKVKFEIDGRKIIVMNK